MVRSTLKVLALAATLAATGVAADYPPPKGDGHPPKGDWPPPKGDGHPPKGDWPPPKGDGHPPKGDWPPPKGDDEVVHWGDWPAGCTPIKFEPYVCDDDNGKEYTTTYTLYPHDCTLYYDKPTPTPHWNTWVKPEDPKTWSTWVKPEDPKTWNTWVKPEDPKTWYEWSDKPVDPKPTWEAYPDPYHPHPYPPKPTDPAKWAEWEIEKKIVIITIIEEYDVPCSTGWAKETTTIYTTHCGCKETPVPEHVPYHTYTTECPEEWGVGKTVTYVVPAPEYTPKPGDYEWLNWYKPDPVTTWAEYTPVEPAKQTTWAEYTPVEPAKDATWSTWATSVAVVAKPTGWTPVASWQGAASSSTVSKLMVAGAGAVAGLALLL